MLYDIETIRMHPINKLEMMVGIVQSMPLVNKEKVDGRYKCSGKIYYSEMTSCAEAKFYLKNCPGAKIDGNNDGVPCEKQWCGH